MRDRPAFPLSRRCQPEIYRENIKSQFITQTCPCNILQVLLMVKNDNFQFKFSILFYFCSKHRMWVHVRTRSHNLFKKIIYLPVNPSFPICSLHGHVLTMTYIFEAHMINLDSNSKCLRKKERNKERMFCQTHIRS